MNSLLTTRQLCDQLSISRQTAYKWRKVGCPTVAVSGNKCWFKLEEVLDWLNNGRPTSGGNGQ